MGLFKQAAEERGLSPGKLLAEVVALLVNKKESA